MLSLIITLKLSSLIKLSSLSSPSPRRRRPTPSQPTPSVKLSSLSSSSHLSISQPTSSPSQPTPLPSLPTPSPSHAIPAHAVAAPAHTSAHAVPADPLQVSALSFFCSEFFHLGVCCFGLIFLGLVLFCGENGVLTMLFWANGVIFFAVFAGYNI